MRCAHLWICLCDSAARNFIQNFFDQSCRRESKALGWIPLCGMKVKGVSPTRADGDAQGLLALRGNHPIAYHCTALSGRVSFGRRPKRNQKDFRPVTSPAVGRFPESLRLERVVVLELGPLRQACPQSLRSALRAPGERQGQRKASTALYSVRVCLTTQYTAITDPTSGPSEAVQGKASRRFARSA